MQKLLEQIKKMLELMGFDDFEADFDETLGGKKFFILINNYLISQELPRFLKDFEFLINLISQKDFEERIYLDINNYRREREKLITELARKAAHKVSLSKEEIQLPPMNGYERRLVHLEIAKRPDLKSESVGEGKNRRVAIKPL